jgi:PIN domain nuclease of toxin-antitoxin system
MRLLLDTHVFLWFAWGAPQLSSPARGLIEDTTNRKWVSTASLWEIAIKVAAGKHSLARPLDEFLTLHLEGNGFRSLPIRRAHLVQTTAFPLHHRDPFDRMLVAQSMIEAMPLVSADPALDAYGITRLW